MREYTDVSITIGVTGYDISKMDNIHVTFKQSDTVVDVTDVVSTGEDEMIVTLTQEQTSRFKENKQVDIQINFLDEYGRRNASDIARIPVESNLLRRFIHG